ncbi:MAG: DNA primase DnaG [Candidatus Micrarchaeota archaeon]|nr:DNA primase DnaG [Candidatus Micrarchaeota archaeon]
MAKTYIDTVKYIVYASCEIDGLVEKPDVVGAIFGQTEGLLGDELDLRELQKNGRIGRIVVELQPKGGKSVGSIKLPSSLDMVETSILAAALEIVDRVGPCEAKIKVEKIEDTRNLKRTAVIERAKELLKTLLVNEIPESKEISEQVRVEVKAAELSYFGPEKLPAGPNIAQYDSIILVEGRADVLNLLKNDITNVVAIGGANISKTIIDLTKEKEVTVFLDGDRGGDIILAELSRLGDIDYVARAPTGKEVEELTRKEIIKCLRAKVPFEQRMVFTEKDNNYKNDNHYSYKPKQFYPNYPQKKQKYPQQQEQIQEQSQLNSSFTQNFSEVEQENFQPSIEQTGFEPEEQTKLQTAEVTAKAEGIDDLEKIKEHYMEELDQLTGTAKGKIYKTPDELLCEIPVRDIIKTLENYPENIFAIVYDGLVTKRLADLASQKGAKIIAAFKLGNISQKPENLLIYTKE